MAAEREGKEVEVPTDGGVADGGSSSGAAGLMGDFGEFETRMKHTTRQRREKDEHKLKAIRETVGQLERTVTVERSQRQEMAKSLQTWAHTQVANMQETLSSDIAAREERLNGKLAALAARMSDMEAKFAQDKAEVLAAVAAENKALAAELEAFNVKFEAEKADRLAREDAISRRQAALEQGAADAIDAERSAREQGIMALRARIESSAKRISKADEKFQEAVSAELAVLRNALGVEEAAREAEDDEILGTLQRYVGKLQASLQIINSSDTELRRM